MTTRSGERRKAKAWESGDASVHSPFDCCNRAKGGVWYKREGETYHPLTELDSFTPTYSD